MKESRHGLYDFRVESDLDLPVCEYQDETNYPEAIELFMLFLSSFSVLDGIFCFLFGVMQYNSSYKIFGAGIMTSGLVVFSSYWFLMPTENEISFSNKSVSNFKSSV